MISKGFDRMKMVTASTQRAGAVVAGLVGDMAASETDFECTPLDPLTIEVAQVAKIAQMAGLGHFAELLQTYCENLDILEGDTFITGGTTYKVRAVAQWYWRPMASNTLAIILEEVK